jgi:hypothetical protein
MLGLGFSRWLLGRRAADNGPACPATASAPVAGGPSPESVAGGATAFLLARRAADDSARVRAGSLSPDAMVSWGVKVDHGAGVGPVDPGATPRGVG